MLISSVHTAPKKFENTASLSPSLGVPSTLIRYEIGAFPAKTLFKPEEFENVGFVVQCGWKTFWKPSFSKTMASRVSSNTQSKMAGDCCVFKFLCRVFDAFLEWNPRFQIPPRSVNGPLQSTIEKNSQLNEKDKKQFNPDKTNRIIFWNSVCCFFVERSENGQKGRQKKTRNERTRKTGTAYYFIAHLVLFSCFNSCDFGQVTLSCRTF